jgi:hypothetical protein
MSDTGRAIIGFGVLILIEAFVISRLARALNRGVIKIDPLFWLSDTFGFEFSVARATNPFWYWLGIVTTLFVGLMVLAILVVSVTGYVH